MLEMDPEALSAWMKTWLTPRTGEGGWSWVVTGVDDELRDALGVLAGSGSSDFKSLPMGLLKRLFDCEILRARPRPELRNAFWCAIIVSATSESPGPIPGLSLCRGCLLSICTQLRLNYGELVHELMAVEHAATSESDPIAPPRSSDDSHTATQLPAPSVATRAT